MLCLGRLGRRLGLESSCGVLWASLQDRPALAQAGATIARNRIVLVGSPGDGGATVRLRAELESEGWEVADQREPLDRPLESIALGRFAVAAVRVHSGPLAVEVWVADPSSGRTANHEVISGGDANPAVLAVQAVEVLRARLLKVGVVAPQATGALPRSEKPTPPASRAPVNPGHPRPWWLGLGPATLVSPGGLTPALEGSLSLSTVLGRGWLVGVDLWLPVSPARVHQPEGVTSLWLGTMTLALGYSLTTAESHWQSGPSLRAGGLVLHAVGDTSLPYAGHTSTLVTGVGLVSWNLARRLAPNLALELSASIGMTAERPVVRVLDREAAYWGRPFFGLSLEGTFNLAHR